MTKAISSIIATLLVLIITIALVGFSYSFISGVFTTKTAEVFSVVDAFSDTITISNDGTVPITAFSRVTVDGNDAVYLVSKQDNSSVGYWKMDELDRITATDSSGKGNTGTFNGETFNDGTVNGAAFASGQYGNGLKFDGVDDFIQVADANSLDFGTSDNFAISAWINTPSTSASQTIADKWEPAGDQRSFSFFINNGNRLSLRKTSGGNAGTGSQVNSNTITLNANTWHHVAAVREGTRVDFYLDGNAVGSPTTLTGALFQGTADLTVGKGSEPGDHGGQFNGTIDEVRIYNRSLSQAEIQDDMNSTYPVNRTVVWYNFENDAIDRHNIVKGKYGVSKSFDGVNDRIVVSHGNTIDFDSSTSFTLSFWLKFDTLRRQFVFDTRGTGQDGWTIETSSAGTTISMGGRDDDSTAFPLTNISITDLNWHFYSFVLKRGVGISTYKDGIIDDDAVPLTNIDNLIETSNFTMGDVAGGGFPCACLLDSVAIYRRALSEQEIKAEYSTGAQINPGEIATIKIYNQLSKGTHTLRLCTSSMCSTAVLRIN